MREAQVIALLIRHLGFGRRGWSMPRWTPDRWMECDLAHVSRAGILTEYEVKLSRSDFAADAHKRRRPFGRYAPSDRQTKHQRLADRSTDGPSRFFFVTPAGMLADSEIPEWAGLLEIDKGVNWLTLRQRKNAPRLHRQRLPDKQLERLRYTGYYRYIHGQIMTVDISSKDGQ